jgi:hypothetical protein
MTKLSALRSGWIIQSSQQEKQVQTSVGWLLSFDLVIKPVIDFLDNCLVLNFQILTTYLDDLNIIQVSYQSLNTTKKKLKRKKINYF